MELKGWWGFDLDGVLAHHDTGQPLDFIGEPIIPVVNRARHLIRLGEDVRVFTARVSAPRGGVCVEEQRRLIEAWCLRHIGKVLPITCQKDFHCIAMYDDRAIQVEKNTGRIIGETQ